MTEESPSLLRGPLSVLGAEDVAALTELGTRRRFRAGDALVRQGEPGEHVHVLDRGRVRVVRTTADGQEILVALRGPGDAIGELAVIDPSPRTATVIALEDVTALSIPGNTFVEFLSARPRLMLAMLRLLARRQRESDRRLVTTRSQDTRTRLAGHLLELGGRYGAAADEGVLLDVPLSQEQLASWVGASREATNAALGTLREAGIVSTSRMRIVIRDVDALREVVFGP